MQSEYLQNYKIYVWAHIFCNSLWFHAKWPYAKLQDTHLNEAWCQKTPKTPRKVYYRYTCIAISIFSHLKAGIQDFIAFSFFKIWLLVQAKFLFTSRFVISHSQNICKVTRFTFGCIFSVIYFDSTRSDLLQNCKIHT